MADGDQLQHLDQAFDRIEKMILPSISMMLHGLLDAASLARTGTGGEAYAAEIRALSLQIEAVTRQAEAISPALFDS
jgi:hypothetical protein